MLDIADQLMLPVVWSDFGDCHAIVIDRQVFNLSTDFEAFFVYITSFSVFQIQWDSVTQVKTGKKQKGFPNRPSLEFLHR